MSGVEGEVNQLFAGIKASIGVIPKIVRAATEGVPAEHCTVSVVATLLVTAAKTVLAMHGYSEDDQVVFVNTVSKATVFHPEIEMAGVAMVGKDENSN